MEKPPVITSNDLEKKVLQTYELLKELSVDPDAEPCVKANSKKALACMWQVVNDLGIAHEQLFEYGV